MNYPNNIKKNKNNFVNYANRGMNLENMLNETNKYYLDNDIAVIYKKPTPIKVVKVDYTKSKITEGYYNIPSTTDYNGLYKGKYIDFEAKETKSKTSFNLKNIHEHQIKHLERINKHNGISFLIVSFTSLNEIYLLFTKDFIKYINSNNRKSIPISYFKNYGYIIKYGFNPILDYLKIVDKYIGDEL